MTKLRRFFVFDYLQLGAMAALLGIGVLFIYSTGVQIGPNSALIYLKQLQWIGVGAAGYFALSYINYRKLWLPAILFYLVCLFLLALVFLIGIKVDGAQRWINIPGLGMRLQPSELTKVAIAMILAALFSSRMFAIDDSGERGSRYREKSGQLLGISVAAVLIAVPFGMIVKQPDLGSALILPPIGGAILLAAGLRWRILGWMMAAFVLIGVLLVANEAFNIKPLLKDYQKERILTFLDPERDLAHRGYNQNQARLAVGSGGMWGKGIGQGTQNTLGFLPQSVSNNDFIFSVIAEETGFAGCLVLLALYMVLIYSIFRTAIVAGDEFGRYLAVGIGTMFVVHVYVNIGMSIGLAPVTGLPLPFVSYGGSFIITAMGSLGLLQSVYRFRE